MYRSAV